METFLQALLYLTFYAESIGEQLRLSACEIFEETHTFYTEMQRFKSLHERTSVCKEWFGVMLGI